MKRRFLLMSTQTNSMVLALFIIARQEFMLSVHVHGFGSVKFKVIVLSPCFNVIKFSCPGIYS